LARTVLLAALWFSQAVRADSQQDFLVFLSAQKFERFSASEPALEGSNDHLVADFLYAYNSDRFRFLAEYIWSNSESELERLKAGWQFDEKTILWFGRFHAISNYWTTEYHHGQYMQTSISRPGVEQWEDESGPMPSHISGFWLEKDLSTNANSALSLGLAAGLAPKFVEDQLEPFNFLEPESGQDLSVSARLVFRPDVFSTNQVGFSIAHNDIAVVSESSPQLADLSAISQTTLGVFSNWTWRDWRLSTHWVYFDIDMKYFDGDVREDFVLGYVQGEYEATQDWTVFGRVEIGFGEDGSQYLQLLPAVIAHRHMLGVRWDFADSHALTLELADTSTLGDESMHSSFKEFRLQWSAVFP
jgi:hypothetical protein